MANDLKVLFQYETDNIDQVESCVKAFMKKAQYLKSYLFINTKKFTKLI